MKTSILALIIAVMFDGCISHPEQETPPNPSNWKSIAEIPMSDVFSDSLSLRFVSGSDNDLGKLCPLSIQVEGSYIYIPNRAEDKIVCVDMKNNKALSSRNTSHSPDFIAELSSGQWYYSSFESYAIHSFDNADGKSIGNTGVRFKSCRSNIVYNSNGVFLDTDGVLDSVDYINPYIDWDFYLFPDSCLVLLFVDHDSSGQCLIKTINEKEHRAQTVIENANGYDTFKILGEWNSNLVILLGDSQSIEVLIVDRHRLSIIKRSIYPNPFKDDSLLMGEFSAFWPNKYIAELDGSRIILFGTSRNRFSVFELKM